MPCGKQNRYATQDIGGKEDAAFRGGNATLAWRGFSVEPLDTVNLLEIRYESRRDWRATEAHATRDCCFAASGEWAKALKALSPTDWYTIVEVQMLPARS